MVPQTNPAKFPEQHRAALSARRAPGLVRSEDREFPARGETQCKTISPAALQLPVVTGRGPDPQEAGSQPHPDVGGQVEDDKKARNTEQHAGTGDEPSQARIRFEFGGVCG